MAQYRVLQKSFINGHIQEEGSIVEYDGEPSENLELIEGEKPAAKAKGKKAAAPVDQPEGQEQAGE